ncbi:MAG: acyltransferase [Bacteroidia bacterium]|nr:acyltransferase [Bacteroidia bacterium]
MIKKAIHSFDKYPLFDFMRKCVFKLLQLKEKFRLSFLRKWYFFKSNDFNIGRNVILHGFTRNISIGKDTTIYDNCIFYISAGDAKLSIGKHCTFSFGVLVACHHDIEIGNEVMIGEYSSIRDTTHTYSNLEVPMIKAGDTSQKVKIGSDVWIGRGCIIMPGTEIENGVVVGANSVVSGRLESNKIYGGNPAKLIKSRTE